MAKANGSATGTSAAISPYSQQQLFALLSTLMAPRDAAQSDALCQLIVDGSLPWTALPRVDGASWCYLSRPAVAQRYGNCLLLHSA
jgi:hypothetical protein